MAGPCVERLAADLAQASVADREAVVERFWAEVERRGAPVVEAIDGADEHRAVTFLWRGGSAAGQVLLMANRLTDRRNLAGALLRHLPGTDVWHLTFRLRADHRGSYKIAAGPSADVLLSDQEGLRVLAASAVADPLNPHRLPTRWNGSDSSLFALPHATPQPWAARRPEIPRGHLERHRLPTGILGAERDVWTYLPPEGQRPDLPVVVVCDGDMWFGSLGLHDTLDALIADGALPPLAVLAPDSVDNATRWRELSANDDYVTFLADELLTWAADRWPLSADPARTVIAGQSLGGLTALHAGHTRPDRFGRVLAQSPSLWWRPGLPARVPELAEDGVPWLVARYAETVPPRPLELRLDVGLHEGAMVDYARALHDVLRSNGHPATLVEHNGGHDYAWWRGALADGLITLLAD